MLRAHARRSAQPICEVSYGPTHFFDLAIGQGGERRGLESAASLPAKRRRLRPLRRTSDVLADIGRRPIELCPQGIRESSASLRTEGLPKVGGQRSEPLARLRNAHPLENAIRKEPGLERALRRTQAAFDTREVQQTIELYTALEERAEVLGSVAVRARPDQDVSQRVELGRGEAERLEALP